jgi:hypothetical protein
MTDTDTEYARQVEAVQGGLAELESRLAKLATSLLEADAEVSVLGVGDRRKALKRVAAAYLALEFVGDNDDEEPDSVLGVVGVPARVIEIGRAVNAAKDDLKAICTPFYDRRRATPVLDDRGRSVVKEVQWMRLILRDIGRPNLNLLAAYRHVPILDARPLRVGYVNANTRSTYRRSREELIRMLGRYPPESAARDIEKLNGLPRAERFLVHVRGHYTSIRVNVTLEGSGGKKGERAQVRGRMPILYPLGRSGQPPMIVYPGEGRAPPEGPGRAGKLRAEQFLESMAVHRYEDPADAREGA